MEKFISSSSNMFKGTSTPSRVSQGQRQSQLAQLPNQSPPPVAQAHRVMGHLPRLHINSLATNIPNISPVPLHSTIQPPEFLQTPQNTSQSASQQCKIHKTTKCRNVPTPVQQLEIWREQFCQNIFDKCYNSLIENEVRVKDLMKLVHGQGSELRRTREKLQLRDIMENYYRAEIIRLNYLVFDHQKKEKDLKTRIAKDEENRKKLEAAIKECLEVMKNINFDFKENVKNLTDKYCDGGDDSSELEEAESEVNSGTVNETQLVIEKFELEKNKFYDTLSVMVELVDMGLQECLKRNEQLKAENAELRKLEPHVSKIHLRKITGSEEIGSEGESGKSLSPPHSSASGDGEWSIVPITGEVEHVVELGDADESVDSETPPVLYPYNVEINETSGERDEQFQNKVKRKRITEGSENKYHDDDHDRSKRGGKKKAKKGSERNNLACELIGGKELSVNRNLGECITLHYSERNEEDEDEDVEKAVLTTKEFNNRTDVVMDDVRRNSSAEDKKEESWKDYGALSDIFCKTCCVPFSSQEKLKLHSRNPCSYFTQWNTIKFNHFKKGELWDV